MKSAVFAALLLVSGTAVWAAPMPSITPSQARAHEGECFSVEGRAMIHPDPIRQGIDIDLANDGNHFVGFIPIEDQEQFPQLGRYQGKVVDVTGVIQFYHAEPEIKMMNSHQLLTAADFHRRAKLLGC